MFSFKQTEKESIVDKKAQDLLIELIKDGKEKFAASLFPKHVVKMFKKMIESETKIQLVFLDVDGSWVILSPLPAATAHAYARALDQEHICLLFSDGKLSFPEHLRKGNLDLRPQQELDILTQIRGIESTKTSRDLDKWVEASEHVTVQNVKITSRWVPLFPRLYPTDNTTQDLAALATNLPERWEILKDMAGEPVLDEDGDMIEVPIYPVKKLHRLPLHKSRGHNGIPERKKLSFKAKLSSLPSLDAGEVVEEDHHTFKVFTESEQRASFWLREAGQRIISFDRPDSQSNRGKFRIRFYKDIETAILRKHGGPAVLVAYREGRIKKFA